LKKIGTTLVAERPALVLVVQSESLGACWQDTEDAGSCCVVLTALGLLFATRSTTTSDFERLASCVLLIPLLFFSV
jgi:hypothetical protein